MLHVVSGSFISESTLLQHNIPELKSSQGSQHKYNILTQELRCTPENITDLHKVGKGHILNFKHYSSFSRSSIFLGFL